MTLTQAIAEVPALPRVDPHSRAEITLRILDVSDIPAMTALVELAQPGPWLPRTQSLGGYVGIFHDTTLVAMAGQRLQPPGYCEISAVCTHPDARRRGYASIVTAAVAAHISERGDTPFLHLAATNTNALAAYLQLGFVVRTETEFVVVRAPSGPTSASE
jgi:predicted GNAT family acetyltransferase